MNKFKFFLFYVLIVTFFAGCGFSSKPIGVTNTFNYDYFETLRTLGHKCYGNYLQFIGEYKNTQENVDIINKSMSELYEEFNINDITVDVVPGESCRQMYYRSTNNQRIGYTAKVAIEEMIANCERLGNQGKPYLSQKGIMTKMSRSNEREFPKTFVFSNVGIGFQYKFDFVTEDDKIFIIATIKIDKNIDKYDPRSLKMKNRFYELLEKNGLKTDLDKKSNISDKQLEKLFCHI